LQINKNKNQIYGSFGNSNDMQAKVNDSINFRQTSTTVNNVMVQNMNDNSQQIRKLLKEKNRTNVIIDEMSKSFSRHNEDSRE
jgi:hypothetical protein